MILKSNTEMPSMQSPDKAPCLRISNNFWILSFDTISSTNSEAAMLFSKAKPTGVSVQPADNQVGRISSLVYHLCAIFTIFIRISSLLYHLCTIFITFIWVSSLVYHLCTIFAIFIRISTLDYHLCTIFITFIGISDNIVLGRLKCQGKLQLSCRATCRVSGVYGVADTP